MNKQREKSLAASGRVCGTSEEMKNFFRFFASSRGVVIHWKKPRGSRACVWNIWRDVNLLAVFDVSFFFDFALRFSHLLSAGGHRGPGGVGGQRRHPPGTRVNVRCIPHQSFEKLFLSKWCKTSNLLNVRDLYIYTHFRVGFISFLMFIPGLGHPFPLGRLVRSRFCIYIYNYTTRETDCVMSTNLSC